MYKHRFLLIILIMITACGGDTGENDDLNVDEQTTASPVVNVEAPELTSFSLLIDDNPELEADIHFSLEGNSFSARLPNALSVKSLVPSFTYSGNAVTSDEVAQVSGQTPQDLSQILTYTVTNKAGDTESYTVDLLRFTGLPIIYLTTEDAITSKEDYVTGTFRLDGWRHHESIEQMEMKIRGRGNSTWFLHPKKPYQMKLESKRSLFAMPEDKKWLFLAEYSDKTLLRNHLAFELGRRSNLRWSPSGHFAEVFVNGQHDGVYHITEKVEEGSNRVDLGDNGFLLEIDQPSRLDPDDVTFRTPRFLINIKEPDLSDSDAEYEQVRQHINEFETVLFSANFADPDTGYAGYIDMDSFVDWFLVNEIAKNVDAKWFSSIYFHWIPGDKIHMGPIWDFDLGFGNMDYGDPEYPEEWWVRWNPWIDRMLDDPVFAERVKERFAALNAQRSEIKANILQWSEALKFAQKQNDSVWNTLGMYVWPNPVVYNSYDEEVTHLVNWLDTRLDWMAEAVDSL